MTKNSKTIENLKNAFAGESQANRKYLAFAKKADDEGQSQIARIFRVAAVAEAIHANNHLTVLGLVKSTKNNLKQSIDGENAESVEMYPKFIKRAEKERNLKAVQTFEWANKVEKIHEKLYRGALKNLKNREELEIKLFYVCCFCGYPSESNPPEKCPVCGAATESFIRVR